MRRWKRKRCLSTSLVGQREQKWLLHLPIIERADRRSQREVNGALARDSLERSRQFEFDSDFIYLENWNLPSPLFRENYSRAPISVALPFINPSRFGTPRPEASHSLFAPFFGVVVGGGAHDEVGRRTRMREDASSRFSLFAPQRRTILRERWHLHRAYHLLPSYLFPPSQFNFAPTSRFRGSICTGWECRMSHRKSNNGPNRHHWLVADCWTHYSIYCATYCIPT